MLGIGYTETFCIQELNNLAKEMSDAAWAHCNVIPLPPQTINKDLWSSEGEETNYTEDRGEDFIKVMTLDLNCEGCIGFFQVEELK